MQASGNHSLNHSFGQKQNQKSSSRSSRSSTAPDSSSARSTADFLRQSHAEIRDLAVDHLRGRSKDQVRRDLLAQRGFPPEKKPNLPYRVRMGMLRKQKERESKLNELMKEVQGYGAFQVRGGKNGRDRNRQLPGRRPSSVEDLQRKLGDTSGLGSVGRGLRGLKTSAGKFRNGTLQVSPSLIRQISGESGSSSGLSKPQKKAKKKGGAE